MSRFGYTDIAKCDGLTVINETPLFPSDAYFNQISSGLDKGR
jgi:hypothetical protein